MDSGIDSGAAMEREGIPTGAPINATDRWSMQDRLATSRNKNDIGQYIETGVGDWKDFSRLSTSPSIATGILHPHHT